MRISCLSEFFNFYNALSKGGKNLSPTFQIFVLGKNIGATDFSADME
jgi:hypothetical protein